ncbi:hypothetical protein GGR52DRAFT_258353 [Hypoxylon sp. FL1284]|nr:hypothetical protein GGR52DRAFT_258353 [Hypoxylon sp. FL1284]
MTRIAWACSGAEAKFQLECLCIGLRGASFCGRKKRWNKRKDDVTDDKNADRDSICFALGSTLPSWLPSCLVALVVFFFFFFFFFSFASLFIGSFHRLGRIVQSAPKLQRRLVARRYVTSELSTYVCINTGISEGRIYATYIPNVPQILLYPKLRAISLPIS